jgi:DNA-directed RNA polymerase subunit RPC12/RpoP
MPFGTEQRFVQETFEPGHDGKLVMAVHRTTRTSLAEQGARATTCSSRRLWKPRSLSKRPNHKRVYRVIKFHSLLDRSLLVRHAGGVVRHMTDGARPPVVLRWALRSAAQPARPQISRPAQTFKMQAFERFPLP